MSGSQVPFVGDNPDIDEVAIERRLNGDHSVSLTSDEVAECIRRLTDEGLSDAEIAERIGMSQRTIVRHHNGQSAKPQAIQGDSTVHQAIERGLRSPRKRVVAAAKKAEAAIEHLRTLLAEEVERAEAEREIRELEDQLRAAKAKLSKRPPTRKAPTPPSHPLDRSTTQAIRAWAKANGIPCRANGPVPAAVVAQYQQANGGKS